MNVQRQRRKRGEANSRSRNQPALLGILSLPGTNDRFRGVRGGIPSDEFSLSKHLCMRRD